MDEDDRDIEDMTPGDWGESGRWDAGHTADADLLLPYTPIDVAVWSHFHSIPVSEIVDHIFQTADLLEPSDVFTAWAEQHGDVTFDDYLHWRKAFNTQASVMVTRLCEDLLSEAEHMTGGEITQHVRRLSTMPIRNRLPVNNCVHQAAVYGSRTCCVCGAEVPRRNPTLDDIPVLE